jgi:hypothetical protein
MKSTVPVQASLYKINFRTQTGGCSTLAWDCRPAKIEKNIPKVQLPCKDQKKFHPITKERMIAPVSAMSTNGAAVRNANDQYYQKHLLMNTLAFIQNVRRQLLDKTVVEGWGMEIDIKGNEELMNSFTSERKVWAGREERHSELVKLVSSCSASCI